MQTKSKHEARMICGQTGSVYRPSCRPGGDGVAAVKGALLHGGTDWAQA